MQRKANEIIAHDNLQQNTNSTPTTMTAHDNLKSASVAWCSSQSYDFRLLAIITESL